MTGPNEEVNTKLPTWGGDWLTFKAYRQRVSLEVDSTKADDLTLLGPRLAKNLTGKAWEMISDVDRERLKKRDGADYLVQFLQEQRGRDKVDMLGDSMRELLMKQDCIRRDGYPRFKVYVKAINEALSEINSDQTMPTEFYGWFLLNMGMRLEPSDIAVVKGKAGSYTLKDIEGALKVMWSGGGLSQKDADRKRWKAVGKNYGVQEENQVTGIFETNGDDEESEGGDSEREEFEDLAAAVVEDPEDEYAMIAFQNAKKKINYQEARKVLARSRTNRDFYMNQKRGERRERNPKAGDGHDFDGDCMRCGKYGHKARNCPQRADKGDRKKSSGKPSGANFAMACEKGVDQENYMCITACDNHEPIYATLLSGQDFKAIVDSGASETIIGVETLQDLYSVYQQLGFNPRDEIKVDRSLRKNFLFGNSEVSEALGLATLNVGIFGREYEIEAHVVEGSAPLLLSSRFLYQHAVTIDFKKGVANFGLEDDQSVVLERAASYHLLVSIVAFPGRHDGTTRKSSCTEGQPSESTGSAKGQSDH